MREELLDQRGILLSFAFSFLFGVFGVLFWLVFGGIGVSERRNMANEDGGELGVGGVFLDMRCSCLYEKLAE